MIPRDSYALARNAARKTFLRPTFRNADDEFSARLMVTSDENILDFMRYETTFFAVSHVLKLLMA